MSLSNRFISWQKVYKQNQIRRLINIFLDCIDVQSDMKQRTVLSALRRLLHSKKLFSHLGKKNWQWRSGHGHFPEWRKKRYFFFLLPKEKKFTIWGKKTPRKRETVKFSHIIRNCLPQTHAQMHGPTHISF